MFIFLVLVLLIGTHGISLSGSVFGTRSETAGAQARVWNCDGSFAITRFCNQFCKSIRANEGYCNLSQNTCLCTGYRHGPPVASISESDISSALQSGDPGRSAAVYVPTPFSGGLHEIPAPDLSQAIQTHPSTRNKTEDAGLEMGSR